MEIQPWFSITGAHVGSPVEFPWFADPAETQADFIEIGPPPSDSK